jgi:hypothetical protein
MQLEYGVGVAVINVGNSNHKPNVVFILLVVLLGV